MKNKNNKINLLQGKNKPYIQFFVRIQRDNMQKLDLQNLIMKSRCYVRTD